NVSPGAALPFSCLTLVYAENGRGKTTLSSVLHSLSTGDAQPILERARLGASNTPHVVLTLSDGGTRIFQNGAWSAPLSEISVFDDAFVAANVCSGIDIASEHRQNLHELILGSQGVTLNAELRARVTAVEEHNRQIRAKADAIPSSSRANLTIDQF